MAAVSNGFPVLIVDDDATLLRLVREVLAVEHCAVAGAETGAAAIAAFAAQPAALVLLDMTLPDMEGYEVCRQLRTLPGGNEAFILFLSGRRDLADKVAGFHAGADDYLTKPVDVYELSLRVRAIRRRSDRPAPAHDAETTFGDWRLEMNARSLHTPDRTVPLTPVEFQLLHFFIAHPETLYTSEALLREIWHYPPGTGSTDMVRFHVRNLRKKIEANPEQPEHLVSIPHHGYMLKRHGQG